MQIILTENVRLIFRSYFELGTNIKLEELFYSNNNRGLKPGRTQKTFSWPAICS